MNELVFLKGKQPVTTSLIIAEGTGNEHRSIIRLIQNYQKQFERWGKVTFVDVDLKSATNFIGDTQHNNSRLSNDGRSKPTAIAYLNEPQATFLITLLRNNEVVLEFKSELVDRFYKMREILLNQKNAEWLEIRRAGKQSKTLWSSEIDSFCRFVTARHFPDTVQLGDINHITDAPPVDIITASSPCQDLSVAGKRGGLSGERSGLFFKAAELVRQIRPRFFVWENVPGAFTSNGGNDFRAVLEEILQESVPLPRHWSNAGLVDGRNAQVGWRLLNAEHWGTPQRRKRIFLVADFGGRRAGEILFEPASVSGNFEAGESSQQNLAARTRNDFSCTVYDNHWKDSRIKRLGDVAPTVSAMYGTGGNNIPLVTYGIGRDAFNQGRNAKYMPTIEYDLCPPPSWRVVPPPVPRNHA